MGACYSCNNCGKCTAWIKDAAKRCSKCGQSLDPDETTCPGCGARRPLNPGAPGVVRRKGQAPTNAST